MTAPHPLVTVWTEERAEGSFVILRTHAGGQVHYGPFSPDGVEAAIMHLGSALAMTAMRYQAAVARPALAYLVPFTSFSENDKGPDGKRRSDRSRRTDNQATVQASADHLLNWEVGMNRRGDWSIGPGEFSRLIYKSQRNIPSPTAEGRDEQHSYWDVYAAGHVSLNGMCFTLNVCAART